MRIQEWWISGSIARHYPTIRSKPSIRLFGYPVCWLSDYPTILSLVRFPHRLLNFSQLFGGAKCGWGLMGAWSKLRCSFLLNLDRIQIIVTESDSPSLGLQSSEYHHEGTHLQCCWSGSLQRLALSLIESRKKVADHLSQEQVKTNCENFPHCWAKEHMIWMPLAIFAKMMPSLWLQQCLGWSRKLLPAEVPSWHHDPFCWPLLSFKITGPEPKWSLLLCLTHIVRQDQTQWAIASGWGVKSKGC